MVTIKMMMFLVNIWMKTEWKEFIQLFSTISVIFCPREVYLQWNLFYGQFIVEWLLECRLVGFPPWKSWYCSLRLLNFLLAHWFTRAISLCKILEVFGTIWSLIMADAHAINCVGLQNLSSFWENSCLPFRTRPRWGISHLISVVHLKGKFGQTPLQTSVEIIERAAGQMNILMESLHNISWLVWI